MNAPDDPSPEELERYLDEKCVGDPALRERAAAMFAALAAAQGFLNEMPTVPNLRVGDLLASASPQPTDTEIEGAVIGRYRLQEKIGEGGFGIVYAAQQLEGVERRVALKIIKLGMDTVNFVVRFEAERQVLANMNHPNIAEIFDAGATQSGRPYFVMQLVDGLPINAYCREQKLGIEARLGLFIDVCRGVQHAHQRGVIHRDLKPFNVLVTNHDGKLVPKIIDFGVAKMTRSDPTDMALTQRGQLIGTPAYMSPEQVEGSDDIDTRSDIYSLGVVLYELLTGRTPFDKRESFIELRRKIREELPPKPSTRVGTIAADELAELAEQRKVEPRKLSRLIRGDLDWIVMKALEKDRSRRYDSANSLLADIERFLNNEAVMATPPSLRYRAAKFARRHRAGLAVAAMLLVLLAVTLGMWLLEGHRKSLRKLELVANLERQAEVAPLLNTAGRREAGLAAIRAASPLRSSLKRPSPKLRDDAIDCLTLLDIETESAIAWDGFPDGATALVFDRSLDRYALCERDGLVSVRETGTGKVSGALAERIEGVLRLLFSPDGKRLAIWSSSGGEDAQGALRIWDIAGGGTVFERPVGQHPETFDFSQDGRWISYGSGGHLIEVHNLDRPGQLFQHKLEPGRIPFKIRFQPGGQHSGTGNQLAIESRQSLNLHLLNWRTGVHTQVPLAARLEDFAWHPAGDMLCVACEDGPVFLCPQKADGRFIESTSLGRHTTGVERVAFGADGSFLLTADSDDVLQMWDPYAGTEIVRLQLAGGDKIERLRVSPDNRRLACSRNGSRLRIWQLSPADDVYSLKPRVNLTSRMTRAAFDPSGRILFLTSDQGVRIWDWENRHFLGALMMGPVNSIAFNQATDDLIMGGERGCMRVEFGLHSGQLKTGPLRIFDVSPPLDDCPVSLGDQGRLLAATSGGAIHTYSPRDFLSAGRWPLGSELTALAVHPGKPMLAAIDAGRDVLAILHAENFATLKEIPTPGGRSLCFSPRGDVLIAGCDAEYRIYRTGDWELLERFPCSTLHGGAPAAIDPSGRFAALSRSQSGISLISLAAMREVALLPNRGGEPATGFAFSPSGRQLAVARRDQTAEVWDLAAIGDQLRQLGLDWEDGRGALQPASEAPGLISWSGRGDLFTVTKGREFFERHEKIIAGGKSDLETAESLHRLDEHREAEALFSKILKSQPGDHNLMAYLALCYVRTDRPQAAIDLWEKIVEEDPTYFAGIVKLVPMYLLGPQELRDEERGQKLAAKLDQIEPPGDSEARLNYFKLFARAASEYRKGDYVDARRRTDEAIEIGQKLGFLMSGLHFLQAMCLFGEEDPINAEKSYAEATRRWYKRPAFHEGQSLFLSVRREASELLGHDLATTKNQ